MIVHSLLCIPPHHWSEEDWCTCASWSVIHHHKILCTVPMVSTHSIFRRLKKKKFLFLTWNFATVTNCIKFFLSEGAFIFLFPLNIYKRIILTVEHFSTWAIISVTKTCLSAGSRTLLASVSWSWTVACPCSCLYSSATRSRAHAPFLPFAPPSVHCESNRKGVA